MRLQLSYLNKFNNANDAYDDLASELKSRQLQRESMHSELEKITRAIASNSISNETRAAFQRISQFAKSDGVYGEMISIELSEFRRRLG